MVKVFTSQEILQVCQHAVELHGGYGAMLEAGVEKYLRDAAVYLHMDATADVSNFKIAKTLFPATAGTYAGPDWARSPPGCRGSCTAASTRSSPGRGWRARGHR
jgi:acyl-CoA dehydrogenase-like protein